MTGVVAICNLALSNLGKDNINALSDEGAEARACNQFFEHTRDLLLQAYPWRFAGKTIAMAELANDKPGDWLYAYRRPIDCLKALYVREVYSLDPPTNLPGLTPYGYPYEIEAQTIYCDLSPAFLRYTFKLEDTTKYSPLFVEALSWHLAVRMAMPLTRDPKVRADAFQLATRTQNEAQTMDANEVRETSNIESDFVAAR